MGHVYKYLVLKQGELKSSELAAILQMSPSAISHQLTLLKKSENCICTT